MLGMNGAFTTVRPRDFTAKPRDNWRDPRLFSGTDLSLVIQQRKRAMEQAVSGLARNVIFEKTSEELSAELAGLFVLVAPSLNVDEITQSIQTRGEGEGDIITYHVPFDGDAELFQCMSEVHCANIPTGKVMNSELTKSYRNMTGIDDNADVAFERDMSSVRQHVELMHVEIEGINAQLRQTLPGLIDARRQFEQSHTPSRYPLKQSTTARPEARSALQETLTREQPAARVFVSYSHDSAEHRDRILGLANRLRSDGIDCRIDQHEVSPRQGWPRWMADEIGLADYVLVVCTETYKRRFEGNEPSGKGKGAKWEGAIITAKIYQDEGNDKFVPIVILAEDVQYIPAVLSTATYYVHTDLEQYMALVRHVTGQLATPRPPLGEVPVLPPKYSI